MMFEATATGQPARVGDSSAPSAPSSTAGGSNTRGREYASSSAVRSADETRRGKVGRSAGRIARTWSRPGASRCVDQIRLRYAPDSSYARSSDDAEAENPAAPSRLAKSAIRRFL